MDKVASSDIDFISTDEMEKLEVSFITPAILVNNTDMKQYLKKLHKIMLVRPGFPRVLSSDDPSKKIILFDPRCIDAPQYLTSSGKIIFESSSQQSAIKLLFCGKVSPPSIEPTFLASSIEYKRDAFCDYVVRIPYSKLTYVEAVRMMCPEKLKWLDIPHSFDLVGHVAHLNLADEWLPMKYVIGKSLIDKLSTVRTVVNKTSSITDEFRVFPMELLAGIDDTVAVVKEEGFRFSLDLRTVYWNSRLGMEHKRVWSLVKPGDIILDMFAGVGPFVVPAAKQGAFVFGNDLNPASVKWLKYNIIDNKVDERAIISELDAREFIKKIFGAGMLPILSEKEWKIKKDSRKIEKLRPLKKKEKLHAEIQRKHMASKDPSIKTTREYMSSLPGFEYLDKESPDHAQKQWVCCDRIIMNLPALAVEFLDVFEDLYPCDTPLDILPTIHVYTFSPKENPCEDAIRRVMEIMKLEEDCDIEISTRIVRDIAPGKLMVVVEFVLPAAFAVRGFGMNKKHKL
ncbi:tRNA (guanine(37)-N(1))-methyltransferase, eukaryotic like protein [Aduncisulcus paluster]|uniref:tRNA (guanine(37)-N1)-methyltransferase n=1 Tax=Aduncisulcus paluster TaxID=2918883 RepID=A0ABQ5KXY2_9EUKA|nr:tRNA (guanine(37)-N(1))-methyltransferase, eukaryotic like protein [Aduncisulcus paluster]